MKYLLECNIDFFSELNKDDSNIDNDNSNHGFDSSNNKYDINSNKCLIYHHELTDNYITLKCGHSFNYVPLYKEVFSQKKKDYLIIVLNLDLIKYIVLIVGQNKIIYCHIFHYIKKLNVLKV